MVDRVVGEQDMLVRSLGAQLVRVRHFAGATIMGAGGVVPVLSVPDLMSSAKRLSAAGAAPAVRLALDSETRRPSVLVVEDSITARTLLKNILGMAGYDVTTAVDGIDALAKLRGGKFELVTSDVDMPRMNGFDLTAKIRADKRLSDLPVVLVTALESREHMERGMEVGANAYIAKGSFDQGALLEAIRRLI